jgi:SAM-dependent methyltransferase
MYYTGKFADTYDKIFAKKNYEEEAKFILNAAGIYSKEQVKTILDFGCGTGTHSYILSKLADCKIVGYDTSLDMISLASKKYKNINNCSFVDDIRALPIQIENKFDLVISMFYVINHINNFKDLESFFEDISLRCKTNGIFIFDCWNAIAVTRDPPKDSSRERYSNNNTRIVTKCVSSNDLMNSFVQMKNNVEIYDGNILLDRFSYSLNHSLWTPRMLKEVLEQKNFEILKIVKPYDIKSEASYEDYKIAYICKKRG